MRLNTKAFLEIMQEKGITREHVCRLTGLSKKSCDFILECGFAEVTTIELMADAVGVEPREIMSPDYTGTEENGIDFFKDSQTATVQFSQKRFVNRVKSLAASHPEECQIVAENMDGSILAHVPVKWIKITPIRIYNEDQMKRIRKNLSIARAIRNRG